MSRAHNAELEGKTNEAISLAIEVIERYGKFADVAELLGIAPEKPPAVLPTKRAHAGSETR